MRALTRLVCRAASAAADVEPEFHRVPLQVGMGGCPWRVAVASMLLCRTRRVTAEPALRELLARWPVPQELIAADTAAVEVVVRPCGFQRTRTRQLQRFSSQYVDDYWTDMRDLTGVGKYVADAVGLFCFGCTELESDDDVLKKFARTLQEITRGSVRNA